MPTDDLPYGNATDAAAKAAGGGKPYGTLTQSHEDFDGELVEELEDLYEGGYRVQEKATTYLHRVNNEHERVYAERCATAGYQGYFSQVVDQFVSELFAQPLSVTRPIDPETSPEDLDGQKDDFYAAFEKDADLQGHPFVDVVADAMRTALVHKVAYVHVDAPADGDLPTSKLEEERALKDGKRLYAYELPVDRLINWKRDPRTRRFEWCVVRTCENVQDGPYDTQGKVRESFTVWTVERGSKARWERFALEYDPKEPPTADTIIPLEDDGESDFAEIPILPLDIPLGLWVGNKVGPMQREHWQRRSTLVAAENRSLMAIPVVQLVGPMGKGGVDPGGVKEDEDRGDAPQRQFEKQGFMVLDADDKYGYFEPEGRCYELADAQLEKLRETMLQVSHQMALSVRPTPGTAQRSGVSKQKDSESTSKVLRELGRCARLLAVRVYDLLSEARGEDEEWVAHGLDTYEDDDRMTVLEEAQGMATVPIPSPSFKKAYAKAIARKLLPGMDPHEMARVDQEIDDGVDQDLEHEGLVREAEAAQKEAARDVADHPLSHEPPPPKPAPAALPAKAKAPTKPAPKTPKK